MKRFLLALILLICCAVPASAERRIALVIGNDGYPKLPMNEQLHNAISDARAMRLTLIGLGFEVLSGENLSRDDMLDKVADLTGKLGAGDIAFVFYAGHGVAISGQTYLLPTDIAAPSSAGQAAADRIADRSVSEATLDARVVASGARLVVIVLDACRDDPLANHNGRSIATARGLAPPPQTQGVLTIHSASVGQRALDSLGDDDKDPNSVFTRVFVKVLKEPGIGLREAAYETQNRVVKLADTIHENQFPDVSSYFLGPDPRLGPPVSGAAAQPVQATITVAPEATAPTLPAVPPAPHPEVASLEPEPVVPPAPAAGDVSPAPIDAEDLIREACGNGSNPERAACLSKCAVVETAKGTGEYARDIVRLCYYVLRSEEAKGISSTGLCTDHICIYKLLGKNGKFRAAGYSVEYSARGDGKGFRVVDRKGGVSLYAQCGACDAADYVSGPLKGLKMDQVAGPYVVLQVPR